MSRASCTPATKKLLVPTELIEKPFKTLHSINGANYLVLNEIDYVADRRSR